MRRLHLSLGVPDVAAAVPWFEALLGVPAADVRPDFAKFLVDDPGLNLALSSRDVVGVSHLGVQVESEEALAAVVRAVEGRGEVGPVGETTCCHARSTKGWTKDPAGLPWELFVTHEYVENFGDTFVPAARADGACCVPGIGASAPAEGTGGACCAPSGCSG